MKRISHRGTETQGKKKTTTVRNASVSLCLRERTKKLPGAAGTSSFLTVSGRESHELNNKETVVTLQSKFHVKA